MGGLAPQKLVLRTANAAPVWRGERLVFARDLVDRTGYRLPPSCTRESSMDAELSTSCGERQKPGEEPLDLALNQLQAVRARAASLAHCQGRTDRGNSVCQDTPL